MRRRPSGLSIINSGPTKVAQHQTTGTTQRFFVHVRGTVGRPSTHVFPRFVLPNKVFYLRLRTWGPGTNRHFLLVAAGFCDGVTIGVHLTHRNGGNCTFCRVITTSDETPHSNEFVRGLNACGPGAGPTAVSLSFRGTLN